MARPTVRPIPTVDSGGYFVCEVVGKIRNWYVLLMASIVSQHCRDGKACMLRDRLSKDSCLFVQSVSYNKTDVALIVKPHPWVRCPWMLGRLAVTHASCGRHNVQLMLDPTNMCARECTDISHFLMIIATISHR